MGIVFCSITIGTVESQLRSVLYRDDIICRIIRIAFAVSFHRKAAGTGFFLTVYRDVIAGNGSFTVGTGHVAGFVRFAIVAVIVRNVAGAT